MMTGEAAAASDGPVETIRYHDDIGPMRAMRGANGHRDFRTGDVHELRFPGRARTLGSSIADCRNPLALYEDDSRVGAKVKGIATGHLADIDAKIGDRGAMRTTLAELIDACSGDDLPDCPILESLAGPET